MEQHESCEEAKIIASWEPAKIEIFLQDLAWEIDERYPNYEARYTSTFLNKAAWEIGEVGK